MKEIEDRNKRAAMEEEGGGGGGGKLSLA